jgi:hypothetical protein
MVKVFPVDVERFFLVLATSFVFEFVRILLGYVLGRQKGVLALTTQKMHLLSELAAIKSEQLEFVKKTKLERKKITIEKEMEKIKFDYNDASPKWKRFFRASRFAIYAAAAVYFTATPLIMVDKVVFWPVPLFQSSCSVVLTSWSVLPMAGFAFRHLLRALAPLLTTAQFP